MKRPRRNHGATFKAHVALVAVKGDKMLAELAEQFQVHPMQITEWRQQLLARAADVFGGTTPPADTPDLKPLHAQISQLALEKSHPSTACAATMPAAETGPLDRLLPPNAGFRDSARADAPDRRAASAVSICLHPHAARSLAVRGRRHWQATGGDPDTPHGS